MNSAYHFAGNSSIYQNPAAVPIREAMLVILDCGHIRTVRLDTRTDWTFGRPDPDVQSRPPDIPVLSKVIGREQGEFHFFRGQWHYHDNIRTKNRIYLNGVQIRLNPDGSIHDVPLSNGDVLRVDNLAHPDPRGVWMLFSQTGIRGAWTTFSLQGRRTTTIGRDRKCSIIQPLPYVAARHALIQSDNGRYILSDCSGGEGTWLNGHKLDAPTVLQEKDWISICDCHFILAGDTLIYNSRGPDDARTVSGSVILSANIHSKSVPDKENPGRQKELLHDVRLSIRAGSLVALLGGSGAGKSTLMNCLNGMERDGVIGTVLLDGENLYQNFERLKCLVGSVPQENTFREMQTVTAEFRDAAMLRLPGDTSRTEINRRVDNALRALGLYEKRRQTIRLLSGGEKKRVNIGVELVADRQLLCLDEPDAGLDPQTKKELFQTLRKLAHEDGKSVIVIIHDVAEIDMFDQVIMMLKYNNVGRLAFSGPPKQALKYFGTENMKDVYEIAGRDPGRFIREG